MREIFLRIVFGVSSLVLVFSYYLYEGRVIVEPAPAPVVVDEGFKNATYTIDGTKVQLVDGISRVPLVPGSSTKTVTKYFGNEVRHDFNKDGREDAAFLLTHSTGGSGTFFYLVASLNKETGWVGSHGFFLGDRIAPQSVEMGTGDIVVANYAEHADGVSLAEPPTEGKSKWLFLDTFAMQFGEVAKDFEGEADPSKMTLGMKSWTWINATLAGGKVITPKQSLAFTLDVYADGTFSATTDCNRLSGSAMAVRESITFSNMISTKMFCDGSQEGDFTVILGDTVSYSFNSVGQLELQLKDG